MYRACAQLGFGPREVDAMELWEIAAVLYGDDDGDDDDGQPDGRAMLHARMKAAAAGDGMPEWGPLTRREEAEWAAYYANPQPLGPEG